MENCAIAKSCPSYICTGTESSYNTVAVYVGTVRSVGCVVRVLCIALEKGRRDHWEVPMWIRNETNAQYVFMSYVDI